jgi:hypothetical protein
MNNKSTTNVQQMITNNNSFNNISFNNKLLNDNNKAFNQSEPNILIDPSEDHDLVEDIRLVVEIEQRSIYLGGGCAQTRALLSPFLPAPLRKDPRTLARR